MILLIAQSLSTAGPGELTRLLRLLAVDGRTRQIRVPAHMVMSVDEEVPERTRPDVVGLLCTPVAQRFDSAWNRINEVDLPVKDEADCYIRHSAYRDQLVFAPPTQHSDLSVAARQALALVTFRRWRSAVGLQMEELDSLEDHLWEYLTLTSETFRSWYERDPFTRRWPDSLKSRLREAVTACHLGYPAVAEGIDALISITYGGLFGGIESDWSLRDLNRVFALTSSQVRAPSADLFVHSLWIDKDWGRHDPALVARWRAIPG